MSSRYQLLISLIAFVGLAACGSQQPKEAGERSASEIYVLKGVKYMENGRPDIAEKDLKRAVELDDNNLEAHNALGVLYDRLGKTAEAEGEFKKALTLEENNGPVINNYGRLLCGQGRSAEAMKMFQSLIDSKLYKTPWQVYTNAGICAEKTGQRQEAEAYLRKALDVAPDFPPALLEMSRLSLSGGNYLSARGFLQRYESTAGPLPDSLLLGAQIEQAMGNYREAEDYLKKLRRLYPDSPEALRSNRSHSAQ